MEIDRSANDSTAAELRAAANNYKLLRPYWCQCGTDHTGDIAYYRDPRTGSHGWMCCHCRSIVQTG